MKKILAVVFVAALMLFCVSPAFATSAYVRLNAAPTSTEVFKVGDEIEFVITADASQLTAMQFELKFPEGLSYVPGSGATPEGLAGKLGVPAADWTEISKMFTFYNDLGIEMKETELVRFRCVAEKPGMWSVVLFQVLPFDENLRSMLWRDFLEDLIQKGAAGFVCGEDFRFGFRGEGDAKKLEEYLDSVL